MFEEGDILYFTPFYFKNGNTAKSKYFVVLKLTSDGKSVLASLPTRRDSVPEKDTIEQGCIELPEINLNCYTIPPNVAITENGKFFDFKTHIYGHQIDLYETELMQEIYPLEGTDYEIWGEMRSDLFSDLINCLINSRSVKRKFIRILSN